MIFNELHGKFPVTLVAATDPSDPANSARSLARKALVSLGYRDTEVDRPQAEAVRKEAQKAVGRDVIQAPKRHAEEEGHEALEKGLAFLDRCLAKSLLLMQPVAERRAQTLNRTRCRKIRGRWRSDHACLDEMCDEPRDAPLPAALSLGGLQFGNRIQQFHEYHLVDLSGI